MCGSKALYTTPIAPLPSTLWIKYLPIFSGSAMLIQRDHYLARSHFKNVASSPECLSCQIRARSEPRDSTEQVRRETSLICQMGTTKQSGCAAVFQMAPP